MKKKNTNTSRNIALTIIAVLAVLFLISIASAANQLLCLQKGEKVLFSECNPAIEDRTCGSDFGCPYCISFSSTGAHCPASINVCNSQGLSCTFLNGSDADFDIEPPNITLISPLQDEIYTSRSLPFIIDVTELSDIYYFDNLKNNARWTRICSHCSSYDRRRSFVEGLNDITIRASDALDNTAFLNVSFFVDSKKPRISKTEPRSGFASGDFFTEIQEENPSLLVLHYGNLLNGMRTHSLDVPNDCTPGNRGRSSCSASVDLSDFDGQVIDYWFNLTDIAGNTVVSRSVDVDVDTTFPVINSLNFSQDGRRVRFILNVTELNFDEANYIDNSEINPREKSLCSRLRNGVCEKLVSFRTGAHNLTITVLDEAGNAVAQAVNFVV